MFSWNKSAIFQGTTLSVVFGYSFLVVYLLNAKLKSENEKRHEELQMRVP
jgi:hypothetical protein